MLCRTMVFIFFDITKFANILIAMPVTMIRTEPRAFNTGLLDADYTGKSMR